MRESTLGMNKRMPLDILSLAFEQELEGIDDYQKIDETVRAQFQGENRAVKTVKQIRSTVRNNPMHDYLMEHSVDLQQAMKSKNDRNLILTAITAARYSFFYDVLCVLGKQFRIQDEVSFDLIKRLVAVKYGANKSVENKLFIALPQIAEAELISRPKVGLYSYSEPLSASYPITFEVWKESWHVNEPLVGTESEDYLFHPYFRFIKINV